MSAPASPRPWRADAWRLLGPAELFEAARDELEEAASAALIAGGPRSLGGREAWFKGSPLRGRAALRHGLRALVGLAPARLAEFSNLAWLREHDFLAVRPLLAGVRFRTGLPRYQFLFTELWPEAPTLERVLGETDAGTAAGEEERGSRRARVEALARDLARLHRLGFVHRDLFPRNLLCPRRADGRCVFLDAWRGGPGPGLRGPDHDLACLFLDAASLLTREEQSRLLTTYREESLRLGRALPVRWPGRLERARARVHRREARRRSGLLPEWSFPSASL